jgi:tetratricopeptide (TPR) repeat protein
MTRWTLALVLAGAVARGLAAEEPPAARVSGRVVDSSGKPVGQAEVVLQPAGHRGVRLSTVTDAGGAFRFDSVFAATYRVRAAYPGLVMRLVEAAALVGGNPQPVWELNRPVDPLAPPEIRVADGQRIRYHIVLARPDEDPLQLATQGSLDRLSAAVQQGRCGEVLPVLEDYRAAFPHQARAHYLTGYCRASLGQPEEGAVALREALALSPQLSGASLLLGQILLQGGQAEEAATWLRREAEGGTDPALRHEAWVALGFLHRDRGQAPAAIEALENAIRLRPDRPEAYGALAELYLKTGDPAKVEETIARSRQAGPADIGPLLNVAIGRINAEDYEAASAMLGRALELAGSDEHRAMAYALLGRCQLRQNRGQEGITSLRRSLELDGDGTFAEECRRLLRQLGG